MVKVTINPDKDFVKEIRSKIKENDGHCACAVTFANDNVCFCKDFRDQIESGISGSCHCGLYTAIIDEE